ncbi:MAG: transposase [Kangiella sp.]|nr:MAG: transposase [Kangiella sp.]
MFHASCYINKKYDRTGTLWEGRYKSTIIDSERHLLTVSRYIELNPVRAGMVEQPAEYPWSSFKRNALGTPITLVTPHEVYERLAKTDKTRQKRYLALFEKELTEYTLEEIRSSVNRAWVLGSKIFKKQVAKETGRRVEPTQRGGDRKSESFKNHNQLH